MAFCYGDEQSLSIIDEGTELPCSVIIQALLTSFTGSRRLDEHTRTSMVDNLLSKRRVVDINQVKSILCNDHNLGILISSCNDEISCMLVAHPDILACLTDRDVISCILKPSNNTDGRLIGLLSGHFRDSDILDCMLNSNITTTELRQILKPMIGMDVKKLIVDFYFRANTKSNKDMSMFISLSQYAIKENIEINIDFWDNTKCLGDDIDIRILYKVKPKNIEAVVRRLPSHRKVEFCYVSLELDTRRFLHSLHHYIFKYKNIFSTFMFHPLCMARMREEPELFVRKCLSSISRVDNFDTLCRVLRNKLPENVLDIMYVNFPKKYLELSKSLVKQGYKLSRKTVMTHTEESRRGVVSRILFDYKSITPFLSKDDLSLLGIDLNVVHSTLFPQPKQVAQILLSRSMQQSTQLPFSQPNQPAQLPFSGFPGQQILQVPQQGYIPYPGLFPGQPAQYPQQGFPQIGWPSQVAGIPQRLPTLEQCTSTILSQPSSPVRY